MKRNQPTISDVLSEARDILLDDPKTLKRKVKNVAAQGDENRFDRALYVLAAGHRFERTDDDWFAVLNKLDECEMPVGEWLEGLNS